MVRTRFVATSLRNCFRAIHHQGATGSAIHFLVGTVVAGRTCFDSIFTIWVVGTTVKDTETTLAFGHKTFFTYRAGDAGMVAECASFVLFDKFTFRVA
mgnify:CR=1 FL=1